MLIEQKTSNQVPNPDSGCKFIDTGAPAYVRPSWSSPTGTQPHKCGRMCFLAVVSINMQPLTGLATSVVKVRRSESPT